MTQTRQWNLAARPKGPVRPSDFKLAIVEQEALEQGRVLVKMRAFANAPAMREWMDESEAGSAPPMVLGQAVYGPGVGLVVASKHPDYVEGDQITGLMDWRELANIDPDARWGADSRAWANAKRYKRLPADADPAHVLGVLGDNGLAAYFGMIDVLKPKAGETVVVSAAAGSTGSIAGQLAKIHGARVVGIASGADKIATLQELGFDATIDRRSPTFAADLSDACPQGIHAYFDNVQGEVLELCLSLLVKFGRVAMCGGVGVLNTAEGRGNYNLMHVVWKRATLQGFSVFEYSAEERTAATAELANWLKEGKLRLLRSDRQGFDQLPSAFIDLLAGRSLGRQLVWADHEPHAQRP